MEGDRERALNPQAPGQVSERGEYRRRGFKGRQFSRQRELTRLRTLHMRKRGVLTDVINGLVLLELKYEDRVTGNEGRQLAKSHMSTALPATQES